MKKETVFNHEVVRCKCEDESLYRSDILLNDLNRVFDLPRFADAVYNIKDWNGPDTAPPGTYGSSMYTDDNSWSLNELCGIEPFLSWFKEQALKSAEYFGFDNASDVVLTRTWSNKYLYGSSARIHSHKEGVPPPESEQLDIVSVFYVQQPDDPSSADFVLVKDGRDGDVVEDQPIENISFMNVKQGDLLFHRAYNTWHGVSLHKHKTPRIMFILEFYFKK